jgi:hypothetical protein
MKKLLLGGFISLLLSFGSVAIAVTPAANTEASTPLPSSNVDGVDVPFEVLDYVQMKYQGYAVTGASRTGSGYQLRANNSDVPSGGKTIYLSYDSKWHLLNDRQVNAPVYQQPQSNYQQYQQPQQESRGPSQPRPIDRNEGRQPEPEDDDDEGEEIEVPRNRHPRDY